MVYSVKSFLQIKKNTNDTVVVIKATVNIVNYTWKMKWRERGRGRERERERCHNNMEVFPSLHKWKNLIKLSVVNAVIVQVDHGDVCW